MQFSAEILDHIFSFLISHRETLIACSKDPILSPIVERHLYYHVVVQIIGNPPNYALEPDHLSKLVSERPHILQYVRCLQIQVELDTDFFMSENDLGIRENDLTKRLDEFAETLLMFPVLECIRLTTPNWVWYWPDAFRAALEDRLHLASITEVHFVGTWNFPPSLLDSCKNIKNLSLSSVQSFEVGRVSDPTLPQLKSLTLFTDPISSSLLAWLKHHISELQSLECTRLSKEALSELLGVCSGTLTKLDLYVTGTQYSTQCTPTREILTKHFPELSSIPKNLQQLVIHARVVVSDDEDGLPIYHSSCIPAAVEAINLFVSASRHLVFEIGIHLSTFSDLTKVDFSPLAALGAASLSIPRIDLYVYTDGVSPADFTLARLMSSLGDYEDIMRSIEQGILVIHPEEAVTARHCM